MQMEEAEEEAEEERKRRGQIAGRPPCPVEIGPKSTEERRTSEPFVKIAMATVYVWNASPIDGTDIIRIVPAIGRELRSPLDVSLGPVLDIIDNPSESVATYL